jgi:hypothetical protein
MDLQHIKLYSKQLRQAWKIKMQLEMLSSLKITNYVDKMMWKFYAIKNRESMIIEFVQLFNLCLIVNTTCEVHTWQVQFWN